jgi:hypothetical protein
MNCIEGTSCFIRVHRFSNLRHLRAIFFIHQWPIHQDDAGRRFPP